MPLFITQFSSAFSDNAFKSAIAILITYTIALNDPDRASILVTVSSGLFILPYFLFSSLAGQLADKYDKARLAQTYKLVELGLMVLGITAFALKSSWFMLIILFGIGAQATFFGPIKYSVLPQQLKYDELMGGNAYIEGSTFIAVLVGTITGSLVIILDNGTIIISMILTASAVVGYIASRFIHQSMGASPDLVINKNIVSESIKMVKDVTSKAKLRTYLLLISWFWLLGSVFLAQTVIYARQILHADATVANLCMILFSTGIGVGTILCTKLSKGNPSMDYVVKAAFSMGICIFLLVFFSISLPIEQELYHITNFLSHLRMLPIPLILFAIAVSGGMYTVPLYTLMQREASKGHISRTIAVNNIINSFFMVASVVLVVIMYKAGFVVTHIFLILGAATLAIAAILYKKTY